MPLFKKKSDDGDTPLPAGKKPATPITDRHDFIPYHGHYNAHTLITKNGELLQTIKIDGNFLGQPAENLDGVHASVREALRQALSGMVKSEDFSFWLHTVRKRAPIAYSATFPDGFAGYVNAHWQQQNPVSHRYYNEIYLTVLHTGQAAPTLDQASMKYILFPGTNRRFRQRYLDTSYEALDALMMEVLGALRSQCSATRLGLAERAQQPVPIKTMRHSFFYSEPMEFLGSLLNLHHAPFLLPDADISTALETSRLTFGFNGIEARDIDTGQRRFGALLSLKQYRDMPTETVDRLLQAPMELVISQSFKFTPAAQALKHYKAQKDFFEISGDVVSNAVFGISEMLASHHKSPTDFGEHQTTVMTMVDDHTALDAQAGKLQHIFAELGLVTVREDIKLEECFWSQFPGNFNFIRRRDMLPTEKVGGFCRLNRFTDGAYSGTHWGQCLSLIPTTVGSPYFFNFHVRDNGHTALFDFNSFGDRMGRILEYFLLSQTQKFNARLCVFDRGQSARLLLAKLGGNYFTLAQLAKANRDQREDTSARLALNPFSLEDSRHNQSFLAAWCGLVASPDAPLTDEARTTLRSAVAELYGLEPDKRTLAGMAAIVQRLDPALAEGLAAWHGRGAQAGLFDAPQDSLDAKSALLGFDMTPATANPAYLLPLFSYLMHRVIATLDGTPTIIVLNEAWDVLENAFFAPRLESLMEMLRQNNAMLLLTTSRPADAANTATLAAIQAGAATHMYLPDDVPHSYQEKGVGLSGEDALLMLSMDRQKGDVLVKQQGQATGLRVMIAELEDAVAIFSGDAKALASARGSYASLPKDYTP